MHVFHDQKETIPGNEEMAQQVKVRLLQAGCHCLPQVTSPTELFIKGSYNAEVQPPSQQYFSHYESLWNFYPRRQMRCSNPAITYSNLCYGAPGKFGNLQQVSGITIYIHLSRIPGKIQTKSLGLSQKIKKKNQVGKLDLFI